MEDSQPSLRQNHVAVVVAVLAVVGAIVARLLTSPDAIDHHGNDVADGPAYAASDVESEQDSRSAGLRRESDGSSYEPTSAGARETAKADGHVISAEAVRAVEQQLLEAIGADSPESDRDLYMIRRQQLAVEKIQRGEFEVMGAGSASMSRGLGDPDFMCFTTDEYIGGERQWIRITFDSADEADLFAMRSLAAESTIERWEAFVDEFNALPLGERSSRIRAHSQAGEEHRRRNQAGDAASNADFSQLQQNRLPWYVRVDDVASRLSVTLQAKRIARDRGGFR